MTPRALDLFCCAGGATHGLQLAGFHVTGVDINPQPHYCGDAFHQADALTFPLDGYDFIWASPPCQRFSQQCRCRPGLNAIYPDLIAPMRDRLAKQPAPFVIENVKGAPLLHPIMLCGTMFGLELYRHRYFECSFQARQPAHAAHTKRASRAGHWQPGTIVSVAGHCHLIQLARRAMGIDWTNRDELDEAIPPAYARFIGEQAIQFL